MSLEGGPFSEENFAKDFGDNVVLFAHVTSRIEGRENDDMLGTVGGRGFPTIAFMSAEGELIGKHNGSRDPEGFNGTLSKVDALLTAQKKVAAGDKTAAFGLLVAQVGMGSVDYAEAMEARKALENVSDAQNAELDALMVGLEFSDLEMQMQSRKIDMETFAEKVCAMIESKRIPTGDATLGFWAGVANVAMFKEDKKLAMRALDTLSELPEFSGDKASRLDRFRKAVEGLPDQKEQAGDADKGEEKKEEKK